jgi:hypothetical protein
MVPSLAAPHGVGNWGWREPPKRRRNSHDFSHGWTAMSDLYRYLDRRPRLVWVLYVILMVTEE